MRPVVLQPVGCKNRSKPAMFVQFVPRNSGAPDGRMGRVAEFARALFRGGRVTAAARAGEHGRSKEKGGSMAALSSCCFGGRDHLKPRASLRFNSLHRRLTDDPPQLNSPRIQHLALLRYTRPCSKVIDPVRDRRQRFAVLVLVGLMIEAERDAASDRPSSPHIVAAVRRKSCGVNGPSPSRSQMPLRLTFGASQGVVHRGASQRRIAETAREGILVIAHRLLE